MKNRYIRNLLALLPFFVLFLIGCEDEEKIRVPELIDGVNMRIQLEPEFSFFDLNNLDNAKLVFSMFSENQDIDRVELYLQYYSQEKDSLGKPLLWSTFEQQDFGSDGIIKDVTLTSSDLADFLGISLDDFAGGDRIDFSNFTHLDDGRVYPDTVLKDTEYEALNIEPSIIETRATTSFTSGFTAFVSCPFDAEASAGTYAVVVDGWGDWEEGDEIEVVPNEDGTGLIVKGMYSVARNDDRGPYDVEILVNASSGAATVPKQVAWQYYWYVGEEGYGAGSVAGGGFVFSCSGTIMLALDHTVAAGGFGNYPLTLQKVQ